MNIPKELSKIYDEYSKKYSVLGVFLYGSQNYGMQTENSDLDVKVITLPSIEDLVKNSKPISTNVEYEHGLIELKDIRTYKQTLLKMNPSYLEPLFTEYSIINKKYSNQWKEIIESAEEFIWDNRFQLSKAIYGMCLEKQKALTHKYPSTVAEIDEIGYSRKQFHHAMRLKCLTSSFFIVGKTFKESLSPAEFTRDHLMDFKTETFDKYEVIDFVKDSAYYLKNLCDCQEPPNKFDSKYKIDSMFDNLLISHLRNS